MKKIVSSFFAMFTFISTTCWLPSSAAVLPTLRGQKRAGSTSHTSGCLSFQLEQRNNFLMAFWVNCKQFGFGVADLQQMFVVGGCREKGLCPNAIPLWPARRKKSLKKKKKRNVLLLVALKYAENFECIYKTFHKLKIYVLMRLRDRSTCSFNFSVIFYTVILIFSTSFIFRSCLCMNKLTVIKDQGQTIGIGKNCFKMRVLF